MKKILMSGLLAVCMASSVMAEKESQTIRFHRTDHPTENGKVNRAPMYLPIEVYYDSDTRSVEIVGNNSIEAEVFLLDASGDIVDYSSMLNTTLTITASGLYRVRIEGEYWVGESEIKV